MDASLPPALEYKRARFAALLPTSFLYTRTHCWLVRREAGIWRVGLTKFGTRMLGEMVDFGFEVQSQERLEVGRKVGWVEGFKAVSELYSPATGTYLASNPALETEITLLNKDPHGAGWLYELQGAAGSECLDVPAYASLLDGVIDELWRKQQGQP